MARLEILYEAIDPYYSSHTQVFIGSDLESCWDQCTEYEKWLGREHPAGIMYIFKPKILQEVDYARGIKNEYS